MILTNKHLRYVKFICLGLFCIANLVFANVVDSLMVIPKPLSYDPNSDMFILQDNMSIIINTQSNENRYSAFYLSKMFDEEFDLNLPVVALDELPQNILYIGSFEQIDLTDYSVECSKMNREAYILAVTDKSIQLYANSKSGFLYASNTLLQLIRVNTKFEIRIPGGIIRDQPRFEYRGLMLDPARNYIDPDYIKRTLDMMAFIKLNVLHLHLTDDQSWRIEVKSFPDLIRYSSAGHFYSQKEMLEIIDYAKQRGITIVPEFDMPAHADALMHALPFLSCNNKFVPLRIKIYGNDNRAICVSKESTWEFLDSFFKEMSALFPGPYIHIGCDEVGGTGSQTSKQQTWRDCPTCTKLAEKHDWQGDHFHRHLQVYFINRVEKILQKYGKTMMGWEEITFSSSLSKQSIAQHWHWPEDSLKTMLQKNHKVILSQLRNNRMYFDYTYSRISIPTIYQNQLLPDNISITQEKLVKGVEACMWAFPQKDLDFLIWPRLFVTAEFGWSPARERQDPEAELNNFLGRGENVLNLMKQRWDVDHGPLFPPYKNRESIRPPGSF